MNSAAVIGRQLRQQAVCGRSSGPLVTAQPAFGKHRPRTPSHVMLPNRPHSPAPPPSAMANTAGIAGGGLQAMPHRQSDTEMMPPNRNVFAPSDRMQVYCSVPYATTATGNPLAVQRDQRELAAQLRKAELARSQPKLRCTWHCFCIAFKALSGGIVLLVVGTVMSVVGFLADANLQQANEQRAAAGRAAEAAAVPNDFGPPTTQSPEELHAQIRNLTFAGPVIMGLGGIVIVAALVLTFEVRDTLGIKQPPPSKLAIINVELETVKQPAVSRKMSAAVSLTGDRQASPSPSKRGKDAAGKSRLNSLAEPGNNKDGSESGTRSRKGSSRRGTLNRSKRRKRTAEPDEAAAAVAKIVFTEDDQKEKLLNAQQTATEIDVETEPLSMRSRSRSSCRRRAKDDSMSLQQLDVQQLEQPPKQGSRLQPLAVDVMGRWAEPTLNVEIAKHPDRIMSRPQDLSDRLKSFQTTTGLEANFHPFVAANSGGANHCPRPPGRTLSHTFSIESSLLGSEKPSYFNGLVSPPDTELSDADGCSLLQPERWRPFKCSCSASPTRHSPEGSDQQKSLLMPATQSIREPTISSLSFTSSSVPSTSIPSQPTSLGRFSAESTPVLAATLSTALPASTTATIATAAAVAATTPTGPLANVVSPLELELSWNLRLVEQQRLQQQLILQQQLLLQQQQQQLDRLLQQQQLHQRDFAAAATASSTTLDEYYSFSLQRHLVGDSATTPTATTAGTPIANFETMSTSGRNSIAGGFVSRLEAGLSSLASKGRSKTLASIESDGLSSSCSSLGSDQTPSILKKRPSDSAGSAKSGSQLFKSLLLGGSSLRPSVSATGQLAGNGSNGLKHKNEMTRPLLLDDNNNRNHGGESQCTLIDQTIELSELGPSSSKAFKR